MSWFKKDSRTLHTMNALKAAEKEEERRSAMATEAVQQQQSSPLGFSKGQREIFVCTFGMLAKVASADGNVCESELRAIDRFMENVLKLDGTRRDFASDLFVASLKGKKTFRDYGLRYKEIFREKPEMYQWIVDVLYRICFADQVFSKPELSLIREACAIFEIDPLRYKITGEKAASDSSKDSEQTEDASTSSADDTYYRMLGCTVDTPMAQVEAQYINLLAEYSPQRMKDLELPEDMIEYAQQKHKAIKNAYLMIQTERKAA